jgi:hypothetical protein
LVFLAHILAQMVFAHLLPEVRNHPYLFFSNGKVISLTFHFDKL